MLVPAALLVHQVCEEFGVTPRVAVQEIEMDTGLLRDVLDVRAFMRAWRAQATYETQEPRPDHGPSVSKAMAERLTLARYGRLMAGREQK